MLFLAHKVHTGLSHPQAHTHSQNLTCRTHTYRSHTLRGLSLHTHLNTLRSLPVTHTTLSPTHSRVPPTHHAPAAPQYGTLWSPASVYPPCRRRETRRAGLCKCSRLREELPARIRAAHLSCPIRPSGSDSRSRKRTTGSAPKPAALTLRTPAVDARVLKARAPHFPW